MKVGGAEVPFCFWLLFTKGFRMKFETLQAKMDNHSRKGEQCDDCPQLSACKFFFDRRVDSDIDCPKCHRWNLHTNKCADCGCHIKLSRADRLELEAQELAAA